MMNAIFDRETSELLDLGVAKYLNIAKQERAVRQGRAECRLAYAPELEPAEVRAMSHSDDEWLEVYQKKELSCRPTANAMS